MHHMLKPSLLFFAHCSAGCRRIYQRLIYILFIRASVLLLNTCCRPRERFFTIPSFAVSIFAHLMREPMAVGYAIGYFQRILIVAIGCRYCTLRENVISPQRRPSNTAANTPIQSGMDASRSAVDDARGVRFLHLYCQQYFLLRRANTVLLPFRCHSAACFFAAAAFVTRESSRYAFADGKPNAMLANNAASNAFTEYIVYFTPAASSAFA